MGFGDAPIRMEGGIADPDEFEFACVCNKCKEKYVKWKAAFEAQQKQFNQGESNEATDTTQETQGRRQLVQR